MINSSLTMRVENLLVQTSEAYEQYRQFFLKGAEDPDWAKWYALYIIEHDLTQVVNQAWTFRQITQFLDRSYASYEAVAVNMSWVGYLTDQLMEALFPQTIEREPELLFTPTFALAA